MKYPERWKECALVALRNKFNGALSEVEKMVLVLYYYEELGQVEIGKVLGLSEKRVEAIRAHGILRIRLEIHKIKTRPGRMGRNEFGKSNGPARNKVCMKRDAR